MTHYEEMKDIRDLRSHDSNGAENTLENQRFRVTVFILQLFLLACILYC